MKNSLLLCIALFSFATGSGQAKFWQPAREAEITGQKNARATQPAAFYLFQLDLSAMKNQLQQAPLRGAGVQSAVVLPFPDGDGSLQHFKIYTAPVMAPGLASKYPGIESYVGQGIEHPTSTIRFSITVFGLHTMALTSGKGTWYIDPYTKDGKYYIAYKRENLQAPRTFKCLTENTFNTPADVSAHSGITRRNTNDNGDFRTYRLAINTTVEYSAFHIAAAGLQAGTPQQKMNAVLSAIVVTMTRVNSMYERDLSVSLQLIENNDLIVHIDSDNLNNDDAGALLNEGHDLMMEVIGTDNFDMGHSFGTGGGGLAAGAPCTDFKGGAMTGIGSPVGDPFDIDYVAHEMGHQFGAGHTFNAECGGNRSDELAFEPGGGTTILAYAGVCDPVIQWSSDAQFHAISIQQMRDRINSISNCVPLVSSGNTPPVANAGADYVIPIGTAFVLEGSATDADGDSLTYDWEQMNNEISEQPPLPSATGGPNFRSLPISDESYRFMPRMDDVLANNLFPQWEVIPTVGRPLDFALTVRDNNVNGGESHTDFMHIDVAGGAGPFTVTSPNTAVSWPAASNQTITWNVAGTTANGVNTPYVDILVSTDGGQTFTETIASAVPNDGSETILVPNAIVSSRIMVRGHNNIFFDISNANVNITAAPTTFIATVENGQNAAACKGSVVTYTLNYAHLNGFTGTTTFSTTGSPAGSTVTFSPAIMSSNGTVTVTIANTDGSPVGLHNIVVTMTSGSTVKTLPLYLNLLDNQFEEVSLLSPANNTDGTAQEVTLNWSADSNASSYHVQVSNDEDFENLLVDATTQESSYAVAGLPESQIYYWRVMPLNIACSGNFSNTYKFATGDTFCEAYSSTSSLGIPGDIETTVTAQLLVAENFIIQDITVPMSITHSWISDLNVKLISPAGTEVVLFTNECGDQDNALVTFSDEGTEISCNGNPAITGTIMPENPLAAFIGENSQGIWTLEVTDTEAGDGGAIDTWAVDLCGVNASGLLATNNVVKEDLKFYMYPNPNNGKFTIQLGNAVGDVTIEVYDLRGRRIYEKKTASGGGMFTDLIMLNAEKGVYLVNVANEGRQYSNKIIIN